MEKDLFQKVRLDELDYQNAFFHFTKSDNLELIQQNGIEAVIGSNAAGVEETPKVFFSRGTEGILENEDVWLKWRMNRTFGEKNESGIYNGMSEAEKEESLLSWHHEFLSKEYLKDEEKQRLVFEDVYEHLQKRTYLVLSLQEGEDFSYDAIDEPKLNNLQQLKQGKKWGYLYSKEMYGSFSNPDSPIVDRWNMHTHTNKGIESSKIRQLETATGKTDLISIYEEIYEKYKQPDTKYELLDRFMSFVKEKRSEKNFTSETVNIPTENGIQPSTIYSDPQMLKEMVSGNTDSKSDEIRPQFSSTK